MKHFVVGLSNVDVVQSLRISEAFKSKHGWWHWIDNLWLVVDPYDTTTCEAIRDELQKIAPRARKIVLEVVPVTWAGAGPREPQDMFQWIRDEWKRTK